MLDVEDFRTDDKEALLGRIYEKTEKHFKVAKHLLRTKPWDFFMMVEMGTDRIHHGFWSFIDPTHRRYVPGNPFENSIKEYYKYCDREIGEMLSLVPEGTAVILVSDHGACKMDGAVCFNEWLIKGGVSRPEGISEDTDEDSRRGDRLGPDEGVGGRRILRAAFY